VAAPLDLIHLDIIGPFETTSYDRKCYTLTIVDDHSRVTSSEPLWQRSDAADAFKRWQAMVELSTGRKIHAVMADNRPEFTQGQLKAYLDERGIVLLTSVSYTPEQNGIAERMNRTIIKMACSMLIDAALPKKYWSLAFTVVAYLRNRSPTRANGYRTLYEVFYGEKPDLHHLHVFGCNVSMTIPKEKRLKLDPKAYSGRLVGYLPFDGGYCMLDVNGAVRNAYDIIFHDTSLPPAVPASTSGEVMIVDKPDEPVFLPWLQMPSSTLAAATSMTPATASPAAQPTSPASPSATAPPPCKETCEERSLRESSSHTTRGAESVSGRETRSGHAFRCTMAAFTAMTPLKPDDTIPVHEALNRPFAAEWRAALDKENANLINHNAYDWATRPPNTPLMDSTTVLRVKRGAQGEVTGFKVRVCVRGFTQVEGLHYDPNQPRSGVMQYDSHRILMTIAASNQAHMCQFDVTLAYLHRPLREELYMRPPPGLEHPTNPTAVWKLNKLIYGTIQGGNYWAEELHEFMAELGYMRLNIDKCVYFKVWNDETRTFVSWWVDDATSFGREDRLLELEDAFRQKYGISGEGPLTWTLNIRFDYQRKSRMIELMQEVYILKLAERFGVTGSRPISTPFAPGTILTADSCPKTEEEKDDMSSIRPQYMELVGSFLYLVSTTAPRIAYPTSVLAKYMSNPSRTHWNAARRVLQYLYHMRRVGITLGGDLKLAGYSDTDWAGDRDDRKSTGTYIFKMGIGAVSWQSKKQSIMALSTTEAEYMALTQATKQAIWIRHFLEELGAELDPIVIFGDNQGSLALARNDVFHQRTKHIDIQWHWIRDMIKAELVELHYCPTDQMIANCLTKALPHPAFVQHSRSMGQFVDDIVHGYRGD